MTIITANTIFFLDQTKTWKHRCDVTPNQVNTSLVYLQRESYRDLGRGREERGGEEGGACAGGSLVAQ